VSGSLGVAQDITERRRLEGQLRQAQKMEAVGQLARGVAHDFNNLLMVIMGYAGLVKDRLGASDPLQKEAAEIIKAGVSEPVHAVARETVSGKSWRGSETILLVEDDKSLRRLILNSLIESGYTVVEAANGIEALRIARGLPAKPISS
jgi:signal transduction histidine kinase